MISPEDDHLSMLILVVLALGCYLLRFVLP
jgi:hypothetical protein